MVGSREVSSTSFLRGNGKWELWRDGHGSCTASAPGTAGLCGSARRCQRGQGTSSWTRSGAKHLPRRRGSLCGGAALSTADNSLRLSEGRAADGGTRQLLMAHADLCGHSSPVGLAATWDGPRPDMGSPKCCAASGGPAPRGPSLHMPAPAWAGKAGSGRAATATRQGSPGRSRAQSLVEIRSHCQRQCDTIAGSGARGLPDTHGGSPARSGTFMQHPARRQEPGAPPSTGVGGSAWLCDGAELNALPGICNAETIEAKCNHCLQKKIVKDLFIGSD